MRTNLRAFLTASDADAITVTPEALRWIATMAAFIGGFVAWCWLISLVA